MSYENVVIPSLSECNRNIRWSFLKIVSCIIIILNSGYALTVGYNKEIALITGLFMIGLFIKTINTKPIFFEALQRNEILLLLMLLSILLAAVVNADFSSFFEYLRICIIIISAFLISTNITVDKFVYYFLYLMRLFTLISLILFPLFKYTSISFPIITNGAGVGYYSIYLFSTNYEIIGKNFIRNSAIFWEAGLFAAFIMLSLIVEIVFIPKTKYKFIIYVMYFIALVSTKSTAAYIYIIFAIILYLSYKVNKFWNTALIIISLIAVSYFFLNYDIIVLKLASWKPEVFTKLIQENSSFTDRLSNPIADMLICLHNPLGCGVGNVTRLAQEYAMSQASVYLTSRTSTLTYFFAAFGILSGFVFNFSWISGIWRLKKIQWLTKLTITISILALATASPLNSNMTFWIIVFMLNKSVKVNIKK